MIICTKEVSAGARKNAYTLLVEIGNMFVRFCGNKKGSFFFSHFVIFEPWRFIYFTEWIFVSATDAMDEYLLLVYTGLTGSVTMITCTVLALTRIVFEYKGDKNVFCFQLHVMGQCFQSRLCDKDQRFPLRCLVFWLKKWCQPSTPDSIEVQTMEQLLHNICLLLSSRTREIVKAALGFIKVILFIMEPKTLASHVTVMVRDPVFFFCFVYFSSAVEKSNFQRALTHCAQMEGIGNIKDDVRRHFRTKLKNVFTKFIRKFG